MPFVLNRREEFWDCCGLSVEVGSTGLCGGDSGHGSCSTVTIKDLGGFCGSVVVNGKYQDGFESIEFEARGDAELRTLADALSWAAEQLRTAMRAERELSEEEKKRMDAMGPTPTVSAEPPDFSGKM